MVWDMSSQLSIIAQVSWIVMSHDIPATNNLKLKPEPRPARVCAI